MQAIGTVIQETMATRLTWASEYCFKHDEKKFPAGIQMLERVKGSGEFECPMCFREANNKVLEQEYSELKQAQEQLAKFNTLSKRSVVPDKTILNARFNTYHLKEEEHEARTNARLMAQYADEISNGQVFNIFLNGTPGVGKSHLSYSLLHRINNNSDKMKSCLFIDFDQMLREIRASYDNPDSLYTEFYFVKLLSEVDVLVLDDLGAEIGNEHTTKKASDFIGRILRAVTNARQDKVTIVTTNLSGAKLNSIYDHKTLSRLNKNARVIKFVETKDKRRVDFGF
ncbi:ATP-binding protein [Lysinibacillus piscis]|uniref:IstB-like ATP-binding domain-containing protein n=1 Tax=Lysinibacillus piscis TaxID=2518931 RepID=A0ABQ5NJI4_9BACI|nr:ATP-binding protein [Lysinibacillus sp. KH24]GLC88237.1 hypothetical protein LYSBPC_13640 [Lysinibacillus sp. KH24]